MQLHAACKNHTLNAKAHRLKAKRLKRYTTIALDFRAKIIIGNKEFIIIKGSIHQEEITILNIYASSSVKVHNAKTNGTARTNTFYNQRFPYSLSINKKISRQIIRKYKPN